MLHVVATYYTHATFVLNKQHIPCNQQQIQSNINYQTLSSMVEQQTETTRKYPLISSVRRRIRLVAESSAWDFIDRKESARNTPTLFDNLWSVISTCFILLFQFNSKYFQFESFADATKETETSSDLATTDNYSIDKIK